VRTDDSQARIKVSAVRLQATCGRAGKPSVLLADTMRSSPDGLRRLLEPECEVVGIVSDGYALIETARETRPDIRAGRYYDAASERHRRDRSILRDLPETHVIFLTMLRIARTRPRLSRRVPRDLCQARRATTSGRPSTRFCWVRLHESQSGRNRSDDETPACDIDPRRSPRFT